MKIDADDVLSFACALAFAPAIIWSEDKKLKKQNKVRVLNTKEILEML